MISAREIAKVALEERKAKQQSQLSPEEQIKRIYERKDLTPAERAVLALKVPSIGESKFIEHLGGNKWAKQN